MSGEGSERRAWRDEDSHDGQHEHETQETLQSMQQTPQRVSTHHSRLDPGGRGASNMQDVSNAWGHVGGGVLVGRERSGRKVVVGRGSGGDEALRSESRKEGDGRRMRRLLARRV